MINSTGRRLLLVSLFLLLSRTSYAQVEISPAVPAGAGSGTVTSVDISAATFLTVTGGPVTTSGTIDLALTNQAANKLFAGPTSGADAAPTFRTMVLADIPNALITEAKLVLADNTTNNATTSAHGFLKKLSNVSTEFMNGEGNWATPSGGSFCTGTDGNVGYIASNACANEDAFNYDAANNKLTITKAAVGGLLTLAGRADNAATNPVLTVSTSGGATSAATAIASFLVAEMGGNPTEAAVIYLGKAQADSKDVGMLRFTMVGVDSDSNYHALEVYPLIGAGLNVFASGGATYNSTTNPGDDTFNMNGALQLGGQLKWSLTDPTIASGFNTSPSVTGADTAAFAVSPGSTGATNTGVVTLPTATTGWACNANDLTDSGYVDQVATTTTSASFKIYSRTTGLAINWPTTAGSISITCTAR
jgi:hypothetical protein